jgi:serine/threonine-protein kinase
LEGRTVNRRYRIDRRIGEGGMAEVYLGQDLLLHRPIAVKVLRPQYARDPNFRMRFEREAQAAASFSHPNIIDIYDVGEEDGAPYIVMEYVAGDNLGQIIAAEGPFDPDDVAALVEQVASALDFAHERGFVHRDIKPQNILVDDEGLAKVVDFGIAKGLSDSDLTVTGTGLGTVHYLSPEQASGLMATPSSDVYSLGVVAYEMLTGQLPFKGDTPVGIALKHVNESPPHPSSVNREVPRAAGDIVLRALAKNPTERFASAGEFASALDQWQFTPTYQPTPSPATPAPTVSSTTRLPDHRPATTVSRPVPREPARPALEPGAGGAVSPPATVASQQSGCVTWAVATAVIGVLAALIWFGFQLAPGFQDEDPTATTTNEVRATSTNAPNLPTAEPTAPAIVPRETDVAEAITVPSVLGLTLDEAEDVAQASGLEIQETGTESSADFESGRISSQEPAEGEEAPSGSNISVIISNGSSQVDIADMRLFGLPADDAQALLEDQGLAVVREDRASSDVAEGSVIDSDPSDVANAGDTVTIFVSVGDKVQVPASIQGAPLPEATAEVEAAGLVVANTIPVPRQTIEDFGIDLEEAQIEDGDVVGIQDNGATFGAWLPPGTSVTLVYYDASL